MKKLAVYSIFFFLIICSQHLFAAPPPPPAAAPPCWPPPCVPIDGGISFLIAAGAAYGAKKLYDSKKNNASDLI